MCFFVCERNFEWCRVHGEGVQGATDTDFFPHTRKLSYFKDVIVLYGLTVYILGLCFKSADISIVVLKERLCFGQEHVPSHLPEEKQRVANIMKPRFS